MKTKKPAPKKAHDNTLLQPELEHAPTGAALWCPLDDLEDIGHGCYRAEAHTGGY